MVSTDRDDRERRLMASIVERDELILRRAVVRENARRRNLGRLARIREREAGSAAWLLLAAVPVVVVVCLALVFVSRVLGQVAAVAS